MSDIKLPLMFCCANGCGVCGVTLKDFVTHATQAQDGDPWVTVASEPQIVSDCCGAEVEIWDERKQEVVAVARAAVQANVPDGWQPIETAPDNMEAPVVVFWIDREGEKHHDFDYTEDGCWMQWHDHAEHVVMIGGYGVSYTPPYTHWMPLPPLSAIPKG